MPFEQMKTNSIVCFLLILLSLYSVQAQDKLLLNNGKIKNLKGVVVYYDYNDIFYQSVEERGRMLVDSVTREKKIQEIEQSEAYKARQTKRINRDNRKQAKQQKRVNDIRSFYENEKLGKQTELSPEEFEKWEKRELEIINELELKYDLYWKLRKQREGLRTEQSNAKFRSKYTRSKSRSNVFSIIREDGTEEIVYNADTLGLLADGEFEVEYGVAEMRLYIKGRQDGRKHSFHDVYIGAATGLASGLVFTYTLDMFYAPIAPAICIAVIAGLNNFKPNPKLELTKNLLESDPYMDGYIRSAKGRKIFAFTMGAIGGLGVGIGTAVATSPLLR